MRSVFKLAAIAAIYFFTIGILIGASIWEGSARIAPTGVLPATGYYAATNAFPKNTTVIVINLENGKTIQVTVTATLDNSSYSSFLILLSKEAADAIALPSSYPGRVRIMEAIDPVTMLPPLENKISNGDPDYDPMAVINSDRQNPPISVAAEDDPSSIEEISLSSDAVITIPDDYESPLVVVDGTNEYLSLGQLEGISPILAEEDNPTPNETMADAMVVAPVEEPPPVPIEDSPVLAEEDEPVPNETMADAMVVAPVEEPPPVPVEDSPVLVEEDNPTPNETPPINLDNYNLALVPAESRVPEGKGVIIPLDEQLAPIAGYQEQEREPDPVNFIPSIEEMLAIAATQAQKSTHMDFSVPIITSMEKKMYYVQLRSYTKPELVESELVKIGKQHNISVQVTEVSGQRRYRILIGPVSRSESNQLLQQYKARGWNDAFVWLGK
jgi:hypothetical protein